MAVAIGTPAVKKLNIAAAQTRARRSLVLGPFVQAKFNRNVVVEHFSASRWIVDLVELGEQSSVSGTYAVDL